MSRETDKQARRRLFDAIAEEVDAQANRKPKAAKPKATPVDASALATCLDSMIHKHKG